MAVTTLPKPKQMQRKAARARLELEELSAEVAEREIEIRTADPEQLLEHVEQLVLEIHKRMEQLRQTLDVPVGVSVDQTAEHLEVAAPTVRKWLAEGLLSAVEGRKPIEVDPRSLATVERHLRRVREHYPAREWTKALAAYLHDRDLQKQEWSRNGVEELRRGEYVDL
ncbi:hypothetical protein [Baekduia sp. Peel2402]|uniref:hypothetical protein n=1 Tax=Baekduia sp. Peel2402 TaxID=3458296 RepID=UPI00403E37BC